MAVRKRKNEKSKSEAKNDDKSENDEQIQKSSSKLSIICLGKLVYGTLAGTVLTTWYPRFWAW